MAEQIQPIEVSITAAIQGLLDGLRGAGQAVQQSTTQMNTTLNQGQGAAGGLGNALGALKGPLMALGGILAGGALLAGLQQAVQHTADLGEELLMASQETGVAVRALSGLKYAAQQNSVEFGTLTGSLAKLSRNLAEAAENAKSGPAEAFRSLGLAVVDSEGNLRKGDQVLMDLADRFAGMEDGPGKAALAMEIFGRSGAKLIPFLNAGRDGIAALDAEAEKLGITMSTEQAAAAEAFGDNMARLQEIGNALMQAFGNELIPILNSLVEAMTGGAETGGVFATAMQVVGFVLKVVVTAFYNAKAIIETVTSAIVAVVMTLFNIFHTLGRVVAAVVHGDFKGAWEEAKQGARDISIEWQAAAANIGDSWKNMAANTKALWNPEDAAPEESKPKKKAPKIKDKGDEAEAKERERLEREAMMREHQARVETLKAQMDELDRGATERIALQERVIAEEARIHGKGSKEVIAAERELARIKREIAAEEMALKLQMANFMRDIGLLQLEQEQADLEWRRGMGQVSAEEQVQALTDLENRKLALKKAALAEALQDEQLTELQRRELLNQQEMVEQEHQGRLREIQRQAQAEQLQEIQGFLQPLTSAFQDSLQGILAGTMSWSNALKNIWRGVGQIIDKAITNMVMAWLTGEKTKTAATSMGVLQRLAIEAWGAIKSVGLAIWTGMKWIAIKGYEAFAGAYSAIASIPFVGPFMAPVVAGAALAAVIGMGSKIASAAGGWEQVPSDQIAQLHRNEMVLPANLAERVRNMTEGGGQQGGGDTYQFTAQFMDARGAEDFMRRNQGALVRVMKEAARNGRGG